jgi:hypothetical protein
VSGRRRCHVRLSSSATAAAHRRQVPGGGPRTQRTLFPVLLSLCNVKGQPGDLEGGWHMQAGPLVLCLGDHTANGRGRSTPHSSHLCMTTSSFLLEPVNARASTAWLPDRSLGNSRAKKHGDGASISKHMARRHVGPVPEHRLTVCHLTRPAKSAAR